VAFVWSQLSRGAPNYTLVQVLVNDMIMVFAFAPLAGLLLGVTEFAVPWQTLWLSTLLYVELSLFAGMTSRHWLLRKDGEAAAVA
jgi:ACR3 family arsenite transporter